MVGYTSKHAYTFTECFTAVSRAFKQYLALVPAKSLALFEQQL